jgi:hypothetical protein
MTDPSTGIRRICTSGGSELIILNRMKWIALCPGCGSPVPRWWFVKTKTRPCPRCSIPLKADKWADRRFSRVVGTLVGICTGLAVAVAVVINPLYALVFGIAGIALGSILGFCLFPYFIFYEQIPALPVCPRCGADLPIPLQRCLACGAELSGSGS